MTVYAQGFSASYRAVLLSAAALGLPVGAWAQDAEPAAEGYDGNEIIVTATKREQTLQDVPLAVSVTTSETLERAQIRDIKDLGTIVPSLRVGERQNSASTNFFIRGFGNGANNAGIEPSVGVFIDGVYRSRSAAQIADFPDVARVEVLRGPQSTLFGKNASAGVISIVTERPKFQFGGNVEASYGNYDAKVLKGLVTGPISDSLAVSLAAGINKRDGYNRNLGTGNRTNDRNRWFVRGQALFEPTDELRVRIIADYGKIDENCCGVVNLFSAPTTQLLTQIGGGAVNAPDRAFDNEVYTNFDSTNRIKNYGVSGQIDYELGAATVTSITAWRKSVARAYFDPDFTSSDLLRGANIGYSNIETFTQELRATASIGEKIDLLLGGFYFNEKIRQATHLEWGTAARPYFNALITQQSGQSLAFVETVFGTLQGDPGLYAGRSFLPGQGMDERDRLKDENFSIFGQVDFEVTDRLTLTGGINYTNDKKRYSIDIDSTDVFAGIDFNSPAFFNNPQYTALRNQLLFQGGVARTVGTQLGLGRSATAQEVAAFQSANPAVFGQIAAGAQAFANANQGLVASNPLNALKALQIFAPFLNIPNAVEDGRTSDHKFTYTARLAYDLTDTVNVYLSYATGYKPSSIALSRDSRPFARDQGAIEAAGIAVPNQSYGTRFAEAENSTVYEAGLKGNWGVASANFAVFQQSIKGFQSNIFTGLGFELRNAQKQSVFGLEFEGSVRPSRGLTLGLALTYLEPKYNEFTNSAFGPISGVRPADIPGISTTFSAQYDHDLGNGDHLILRGSYHYESKVRTVEGLPAYIDPAPIGSPPGTAPNYAPGLEAASRFTREVNEADASITYAMDNGLELGVWGRNLLDDRNISVIFDSSAQRFSISGYTTQPRTYGGFARFRW